MRRFWARIGRWGTRFSRFERREVACLSAGGGFASTMVWHNFMVSFSLLMVALFGMLFLCSPVLAAGPELFVSPTIAHCSLQTQESFLNSSLTLLLANQNMAGLT